MRNSFRRGQVGLKPRLAYTAVVLFSLLVQSSTATAWAREVSCECRCAVHPLGQLAIVEIKKWTDWRRSRSACQAKTGDSCLVGNNYAGVLSTCDTFTQLPSAHQQLNLPNIGPAK